MPKLILLAGIKHSGKSTLAKQINAEVLSFAAPFKELLRDCGVLTTLQAFGDDNDKNTLTNVQASDMPDFIQRKYGLDPRSFLTARQVMQYFGNDICKMFGKNVWVNHMITRIGRSKADLIVIDDFRFFGLENNLPFPNRTIYLDRKDVIKIDGHESENAVRADQCDLVLHVDHNDPDNLRKNVEIVYNYIKDFLCTE